MKNRKKGKKSNTLTLGTPETGNSGITTAKSLPSVDELVNEKLYEKLRQQTLARLQLLKERDGEDLQLDNRQNRLQVHNR